MLLAFPSHDLIWDATLTMSDEDPDYPVENVQNNDPSDTAKANGTSTTIEVDISGGNQTVVGLLLANTNGTTGSIESAGGAIGAFTFPARLPDGKLKNGWLDLRGLPNVTEDHFEIDLSKTGSAVLEIGRICLVTAWQAPEILVAGAGTPPTFGHRRHGQVENLTKAGASHRRIVPWAKRRHLSCATKVAATLAILQQLEAENLGLGRGFALIPNEDENDGWFADLALTDFAWVQDEPDDGAQIFPVQITFHEIAMGLPPGPD